jgi:hypothetical protein
MGVSPSLIGSVVLLKIEAPRSERFWKSRCSSAGHRTSPRRPSSSWARAVGAPRLIATSRRAITAA